MAWNGRQIPEVINVLKGSCKKPLAANVLICFPKDVFSYCTWLLHWENLFRQNTSLTCVVVEVNSASHGVDHRLWLLKDLLLHEGAVVACVGRIGGQGNISKTSNTIVRTQWWTLQKVWGRLRSVWLTHRPQPPEGVREVCTIFFFLIIKKDGEVLPFCYFINAFSSTG